MCVCLCLCVCVSVSLWCVCVCLCMWYMSVYVCVCGIVHVCLCVWCVYLCICVSVCGYVYLCVSVSVSVCACVSMHMVPMRMSVCVTVCGMCIYICMLCVSKYVFFPLSWLNKIFALYLLSSTEDMAWEILYKAFYYRFQKGRSYFTDLTWAQIAFHIENTNKQTNETIINLYPLHLHNYRKCLFHFCFQFLSCFW